MKWIRKISSMLVGGGIIIYLFIALGFTGSKMSGQKVQGIAVEIRNAAQTPFLTEQEVIQVLINHSISITNQPIDSINKSYVKEVVTDIPQVNETSVFFTPDGIFHIKISQRIPIMRVITRGVSYYADQDGAVFPISNNFTLPVPVFSGNIGGTDLADGLVDIALYLQKNPSVGALVQQVHVWDMNTIELVPRFGKHKIDMGGPEDMEWKFTKLEAFYREVVPKVGWDKYKSLDLQFGDQVVCK